MNQHNDGKMEVTTYQHKDGHKLYTIKTRDEELKECLQDKTKREILHMLILAEGEELKGNDNKAYSLLKTAIAKAENVDMGTRLNNMLSRIKKIIENETDEIY